jgi:hypothetical protein
MGGATAGDKTLCDRTRARWSVVVSQVPRWLLLVCLLTGLPALLFGIWLDKSDHSFIVNVLSSLFGAAIGLPIVTIGLQSLLQRDQSRRELAPWARTLQGCARQIDRAVDTWTQDVLRGIEVEGRRAIDRLPGGALTADMVADLRRLASEPLLTFKGTESYLVPGRYDPLTNSSRDLTTEEHDSLRNPGPTVLKWVSETDEMITAVLEDLRLVRGAEPLAAELWRFKRHTLQDSDKTSFPVPVPRGWVSLSKLTPGEERARWIEWCVTVSDSLLALSEGSQSLKQRADSAKASEISPRSTLP